MSTNKWAKFAKKFVKEQESSGLQVSAPPFNNRVKGNVIWPRNTKSTPVLGSRVVGMIQSPNAPKSRKGTKGSKGRKTRKTRK